MRSTLANLIVAAGLSAGLAGAASAQPAPAAESPATAPATAAPAVTTPTDTPPAAMEAPAAAPSPPAAPAEPAPPPPTLPTTGDGAVMISLLEKVCVPAVRGQGFETTAKAMGFKLNKREGTWTMTLGAKPYLVTLLPQGSNRNVCMAEVRYAVGQDEPIITALNIWSFLHEPELILQANYVNVDPDGIKRTRKSWESLTSTASTAVNFSVMRKPDDSPLNARYDTGMLFYQERTF